jgi:hypothetical protein
MLVRNEAANNQATKAPKANRYRPSAWPTLGQRHGLEEELGNGEQGQPERGEAAEQHAAGGVTRAQLDHPGESGRYHPSAGDRDCRLPALGGPGVVPRGPVASARSPARPLRPASAPGCPARTRRGNHDPAPDTCRRPGHNRRGARRVHELRRSCQQYCCAHWAVAVSYSAMMAAGMRPRAGT